VGAGCTTDIDTPPVEVYLAQTSPANVLENLRRAYRNQNDEVYADQLATDFLFYFDPDTRSEKQLPEFWNKTQDSTQTYLLFESDQVSDIRIELTYIRESQPVNEVGREHWELINVTDETLEVDLKPEVGQDEGVTLLVEGQIHKFYFRRGRTEADTAAASPTSKNYYIVEWRDQGRQL
jgi:hypothetical protein